MTSDDPVPGHGAPDVPASAAPAALDGRLSPPASPFDGAEAELDALGEALGELRSEILTRFPAKVDRRARPPAGHRAPESRAPLPSSLSESLSTLLEGPDWLALLDALRKRAGNIGMVERSADVDDFGFEASALESMRPLLDFLLDTYWRARGFGFERLPRDVPSLFVANRAGLLPYDGLMLSHALEREQLPGERPRFLVADWLVTLPFVQANLARLGGVRACRENAERLLRTGHSVIAFPEGVKGAAKLFRERYQIQRFGRGGAVRVALENGVPLVPVGLAGPEEAHPVLAKPTLPASLLGLPFVPVTPTFPWFGPLGALPLPTQWIIAVGEPMDLRDHDPADAKDAVLVERLNEELRERIRQRVRFALDQRETVWG